MRLAGYDRTLSHEPEARRSPAPEPGRRSTNVSAETGAVCPLNSCRVFPVCAGARFSSPQRRSDGSEGPRLKVKLANDGGVFGDPGDIVTDLYRQRFPDRFDGTAEVLYALCLLLAGLNFTPRV